MWWFRQPRRLRTWVWAGGGGGPGLAVRLDLGGPVSRAEVGGPFGGSRNHSGYEPGAGRAALPQNYRDIDHYDSLWRQPGRRITARRARRLGPAEPRSSSVARGVVPQRSQLRQSYPLESVTRRLSVPAAERARSPQRSRPDVGSRVAATGPSSRLGRRAAHPTGRSRSAAGHPLRRPARPRTRCGCGRLLRTGWPGCGGLPAGTAADAPSARIAPP